MRSAGCQSVKGLGKTQPAPKQKIVHDGMQVPRPHEPTVRSAHSAHCQVPLGKAEASGTKDSALRSFTVRPFDPVGQALTEAGIKFEFAEYLKGETHYIVVTIKKRSLLEHGVLKQDLPQGEILSRANLDEAALLKLGRLIATALELPASTEFCDYHPAKLFDFSTRARCLAGFRVLGVEGGGANVGKVKSADLEAQELLSRAETAWHKRSVEEAQAAVEARVREIGEAEQMAAEVAKQLQTETDEIEQRQLAAT